VAWLETYFMEWDPIQQNTVAYTAKKLDKPKTLVYIDIPFSNSQQ